MAEHIRSHRHRHRPGRLCLRDARSAAGHEGRGCREMADLWRHLPQHRLHPVQGAAACLRNVRGGRSQLSASWVSRSARPAQSVDHDGAQGRYCGLQYRRHRISVQEEQDHRVSRHRLDRGAGQGRVTAEDGTTHRDRDAKISSSRPARFRPPAGYRDRRGAHRYLDRRAQARSRCPKICW